ncbi:hypothetical protein M0Q03_03890 [bacterium]|jgi:hypothetical protein|nr:hypothetical protein [bacterium]
MKKWQKILLKIGLYLGYVFFSIGVPIWLIAEKYDIFSTKGSLTGMGIIVCILIIFFTYNRIKEFSQDIKTPILKGIVMSVLRILPLVALLIALNLATQQMSNFMFITTGSLISNASGGSIFYILFQHFKSI